MRPIDTAREFACDFFAAKAVPGRTSFIRDTPATVLIAIGTLSSYVKTTREFMIDVLGIPGALLPTIVSLLAFAACIVAISSKKTVNPAAGFSAITTKTQEYSFGIWTRRFAKIGLIALALVIPYNVAASIEETLPLPLSISGIVLEARDGRPVEGAKVRIITTDGVDVTDSSVGAETDSNGVFVLRAKQRVRRSGTLSIYREGCKSDPKSLWRRFETSAPSSLPYVDKSVFPFFLIYIECQG